MPINNINSNAPSNMQPYIRALEDKLKRIEEALATLGVKL